MSTTDVPDSADTIPSDSTTGRPLAIAYSADDTECGMMYVIERLDRCRQAATTAGFRISEHLEFYDGLNRFGAQRRDGRRRMWAAIKKGASRSSSLQSAISRPKKNASCKD